MFAAIGGIIGALGFFGNVFLIVIIYVALTRLFGNYIHNLFMQLIKLYINLRIFYYKIRCHYNPAKELKDKYRRSVLHITLVSMQTQIDYLTNTYGYFEICSECKFPHKPDPYCCPYCKHTPDDNFAKASRYLKEGY